MAFEFLAPEAIEGRFSHVFFWDDDIVPDDNFDADVKIIFVFFFFFFFFWSCSRPKLNQCKNVSVLVC